MNRADFLKRGAATVGGVVLGGVGAAQALAKKPVAAPAPARQLLAAGKVKGVNIVSTPADPGYDGSWSTFWRSWPWASIQAQVDMSRKVAGGANAARLIGGVGCIYDGTVTLQQYLDRQCQFVAYCQSVGVSVEVVGCALEHTNGAPQATVVGYVQAIVQAVSQYSNVTDIDLCNEIIGGGYTIGLGSVGHDAAIIAYAAALYGACKPLSSIPMGFSHSYPAGDYRVAELAPYSDTLLFHWYPGDIPTVAQVNAMLAVYPSKPFLIGEFGDSLADSSKARVAAYQSIEALHALASCSGSILWAAVDQQGAAYPWLQYGMWPSVSSKAPRSDIYGVWRGFAG